MHTVLLGMPQQGKGNKNKARKVSFAHPTPNKFPNQLVGRSPVDLIQFRGLKPRPY